MRRLLALLALAMLASCVSAPPVGSLEGARVLVFSHTTGYRHVSIEVAAPTVARLVREEGGEAVLSEDPAAFDPGRLDRFRAIVLLSTTTDPNNPASEWLTAPRREALQDFLRRGHGVVAIHAAADSHYAWPWYGEMIGGRFLRHPPGTHRGRLAVVDAAHPATSRLPRTIEHVDEWYAIRDFDPHSRLLMTLDPASIAESGAPWPMSWVREFGGGRVFYTALGHTAESWSEPFFLEHLRGGLRWAAERRRH